MTIREQFFLKKIYENQIELNAGVKKYNIKSHADLGSADPIVRRGFIHAVADIFELIAIRKIGNMAFRHLSETEIKWLRGKMNDSRPEVKAAAHEAHTIKFPHYERNMMKKGLTARSLEFFVHAYWL